MSEREHTPIKPNKTTRMIGFARFTLGQTEKESPKAPDQTVSPDSPQTD